MMAQKSRVFPGCQRLDEDFRHFVDRDDAAVLDENPADFLAIPVENDAGFLEIIDACQIISGGPITILPGVTQKKDPTEATGDDSEQEHSQPKAFELEEDWLPGFPAVDILSDCHA